MCPLSADKNGHFTAEIVPMEVKGKKGKEMFVRDEHPRETTLEKLGNLPPIFKKDGVVSAGNASVCAVIMLAVSLYNIWKYSLHMVYTRHKKFDSQILCFTCLDTII